MSRLYIENPTPQIGAYLLEKWSYQIPFRSDLKRLSIEDRRRQQNVKC